MLGKDGGRPALQAAVPGRNSECVGELGAGAGARAGVLDGTGTDREGGGSGTSGGPSRMKWMMQSVEGARVKDIPMLHKNAGWTQVTVVS